MEKKTKIFISHSSQDKEYVTKLVELLEAIGVPEDGIFCSSLPGYGVKPGEHILNRLRNEFQENDLWVFYVLSDHFLESQVCMNELGAGWVLQKRNLVVYLPGFDKKKTPVILDRWSYYLSLDSENVKYDLNNLKDKITEVFGCRIKNSNIWEDKRRKFIDGIQACKTLRCQDFRRNGDQYRYQKKFEDAIRSYSRAIDTNPSYVDAYILRAISWDELKKYDEALADYNKAIELAPRYALAYNNRGATYRYMKNYPKAIADCTKAIELDSNFANAYRNRELSYRAIGQIELAEADKARAEKLAGK